MKKEKQPQPETKPEKSKLQKKHNSDIYDNTLTALNKALSGKNPLEQYREIPNIVSMLVGLDSPLQTYYINTLSYNHKIEKETFRVALKEAQLKIKETKEAKNISNDPQVEKLERFISEYYEMRNNVISHDIEVKEKDVDQDFKPLKELDLLRTLRKNHFKIKVVELMETIMSDFTPEFNPIVDYFDNLPEWDGKTDYVAKLCSYIHLVDEKERNQFNLMFEKQLLRMITGSLGITFNKQCFVLVGSGTGTENQNIGKSTFIRFLCPKELKQYYTEEFTLDKDGLILLSENIMCNIDELSILHKGELNQLKAVMSKDIIKVRLPYTKKPSVLKRRVSFFASSNEANFLTDLTGNVRWIAYKIKSLNWDYATEINMDNVYSQLYSYILNGKDGKPYNGQLSIQEVQENELHNQQFMLLPPEMELIPIYLQSGKREDEGTEFFTTTEIVKLLHEATLGSSKFTVNAVGRALRALKFEVSEFQRNKNYSEKGYWCKVIKSPFAKKGYQRNEEEEVKEEIKEKELPF